MDLYFAGEHQFKISEELYLDLYLMGYNRLLSYGYQNALVDKLISKVKEMDLYLAGANQSKAGGASVLLDQFNCLLSYAASDEKRQVNKFIKRIEEMDLFFAGSDKLGIEERRRVLDLYLVGPEKEEVMKVAYEEEPSNILFSYLTAKAVDKYKNDVTAKGKLFIDSGAFSAWTQGKVIDVDQYINWINERADYISLYGQIDVIPGDRNSGRLPTHEEVRIAAQKTWENYLYMRPKMKKPEGLLYTFHVGEPIEFLKQALEWVDENGDHIPYIALGGMVGKPAEVRDRFLEQCFDVISKSSNPNVKVHAFGMTDKSLLIKYPITSADSTSWIMTAATGSIMTDAGVVSVSSQQKNDPNHFSHLTPELQEAFNKTIEEFGFTLEELADSRDKRIMHNARYMKKKFADIEYKPVAKKRKLF